MIITIIIVMKQGILVTTILLSLLY